MQSETKAENFLLAFTKTMTLVTDVSVVWTEEKEDVQLHREEFCCEEL